MKNLTSLFVLIILTIANAHSADEKQREDPTAKFVRENIEKQKKDQERLFERSGVPSPSKSDSKTDSSKGDDKDVCWGKNTATTVRACR